MRVAAQNNDFEITVNGESLVSVKNSSAGRYKQSQRYRIISILLQEQTFVETMCRDLQFIIFI